MNTTIQPVLFLSHGSPMMGIEDSPTARFLSSLGQTLNKPDAIVVFSAHFDLKRGTIITSGPHPETIHDFYGFPEALYAEQYPAPGAPELAREIGQRFQDNQLPVLLKEDQGWDHGVWIPLKRMFPDADIPIVQISINSLMSPETNFRYGQLIGDLRARNILIIGSGGISHNLREVFSPTPLPHRVDKVNEFTNWVYQALVNHDTDKLLDYRRQAPHAAFNHPSQEHFMPLIAVLGASDGENVTRIHQDMEFEILALDSYRFA